jgi:flagellar biosynthetic protein FliR
MNEIAPVVRFALLLVRPGMIVMMTPFFGGTYAPAKIRAGATIIFALILTPVVPAPTGIELTGLTVVVLREILIGLALAFGVRALIAGADFAGHLMGYQIGLSYGSLVDPQSGVRNTVLATLYSSLATVIAFAIGAHHAIVRAMTASYQALPIGFGGVDPDLVSAVSRLLGVVFVLGLRIAAPVVVVLLLTEALLGLMARVAPSFNVLAIGAPGRLVVGLLVIAATIVTLPPLVSRFAPATLEMAIDLARTLR